MILYIFGYILICTGSVMVVCWIYDRGVDRAELLQQANENRPWVCPRCRTLNNDNRPLTNYQGKRIHGGCQVCFEIEQTEKIIFLGEKERN